MGAATGVETDAVATVVAGVTMETAGGGPEVSTVGVTVAGDERVGTVVQDVDRGHWETVDGDGSVVLFTAVTVWVPLVT